MNLFPNPQKIKGIFSHKQRMERQPGCLNADWGFEHLNHGSQSIQYECLFGCGLHVSE